VASIEAARERRRCFGRRSGREQDGVLLRARQGSRDPFDASAGYRCRQRTWFDAKSTTKGLTRDVARRTATTVQFPRRVIVLGEGSFARATLAWLHAGGSRDQPACGDVMAVDSTRLGAVHRKRFSYIRGWKCVVSMGVET
jgi:hypothetical protein